MTAALEGDEWHAPASLYPRERPGTHFTGGWVGPRAGLDGYGKSLPHRDSIPDRPARSSVAIQTKLPGPHTHTHTHTHTYTHTHTHIHLMI